MTQMAQAAVGFPPRSVGTRAMVAMALVGFVMSMDMSLTNLLVEPVKRDLALSDIEVGLLQGTAFGLALGLGSVPMGRLIDRYARLPLLLLALLVWIAAMSLSGLAANYATMVAARAALGLVAALMVPAALSLLADFCPPERRSAATSLFIVGQAAGQALGVTAGGLVVDWIATALVRSPGAFWGLAPWRLTYLAAALVGALLAVPMLALREPRRQEVQAMRLNLRGAIAALWSHRIFLAPLLAALLLTQFTLQAASVWSPAVLIRNYGFSPGQFVGWLGPVFFVGGIAGAAIGGRLGEIGRRRASGGGVLFPALIAALFAVPTALFAIMPSVSGFAVLLGLNMLLNVVITTLGAVAITLHMPNELRGLSLGTNSLLSGLFSLASAPAIVALLSGELGGDAEIGPAIAVACIPAGLLATVGLLLAVRGQRSSARLT